MSVTEKSARSDSFSIYKHFFQNSEIQFSYSSNLSLSVWDVRAFTHGESPAPFLFLIDKMLPVLHKQPEYFQQPPGESNHLQTSQTVHLP